MTYKLFSNCVPVKGFNKSIIVDLQRNDYKNIPNSLYQILCSHKILDFEKLKCIYEDQKIIEEYKAFLIENEFIFECSEHEVNNFPAISTDFYKPFHITNAVIEISNSLSGKIHELKNSFDELGVQDCFLLFYEENIEFLNDFFTVFDDSRLLSVQLLYPTTKKINIKRVAKQFPRVTKIIFFNAKYDKIVDNTPAVIYSTKSIDSFKFCGEINNYFVANTDTFLESLNHNSCLHKKIAIDRNGNIKNCPAMPQSFGNIKDTTLEEAFNHSEFKKYWNVTKDMIQVCKDCEFRHICTDCRAYTERTYFEGDIDLSKPLKCGYNPYTNEWAEWSTSPIKQKAIEFYEMRELFNIT
ncbi:grasp-with-spasm system SPASM domain peptide maturase [Sinomicrobium weinanense]|uniref:Grasp-with-spasm system SPASM domain peptide maturase n=1 Tax=Sinomicrobium weinanense TaxID=2842200 RepID=A0A926JVR6_9FLAO|nr:grasp-with-spasm system SPASM domain peptide maturase [Sinomicrobium weinanense]MBC9798467.1 grasp-with-spasm system SPASM domain peptide maturase [Sinomicrobium weinanense]MBU3126008.1 grasp-with-spasm system SPASM domain peptide maturase [Sinomicrobium weinanense]